MSEIKNKTLADGLLEIAKTCVDNNTTSCDITMEYYLPNNDEHDMKIKYHISLEVEHIPKKLIKTCGDCDNFGTVNCSESYREPTLNDNICDGFC